MIERMRQTWHVMELISRDSLEALGVDDSTTASFLWRRGLRNPEQVAGYLDPHWETHTHEASAFQAMAGAVERVFRAFADGERITVHGDYDADGVTGSTVLVSALREISQRCGADPLLIDFYIPHRDKEGYGLHRETIAHLKERGTKLIVTVDCGIACVEEIALAKADGIDTIVVDHHQFGETLPDGYLIHPSLPEETYPFKSLAAVGVSFKVASALLAEARKRGCEIPVGWEKWLLDLVAIATVTDMVPLIGENRVLLKYGLRVLNKTRRPGLLALLRHAGIVESALTEESIGFTIGPRLNAAGRMDHATLALRLLLSESHDEAELLAREIERCNRERQEATKKMMAQAEEKVSVSPTTAALVLWDERWSPSLVGLVAGRFVERFGKPTVVVGCHDGRWIGSGRSSASFDITAAVRIFSGE